MPGSRQHPTPKPLHAGLKRPRIGDYLNTPDYKLRLLGNRLDDLWEVCEREVRAKRRVILWGFHNTDDDEEALMYCMSVVAERKPDYLGPFVLDTLLDFARWKPVKINVTSVITRLQDLQGIGLDAAAYESFASIQETKPDAAAAAYPRPAVR